MIDFFKSIKFSNFLAFWVITALLAIYLFAIMLPEKFANSPIVTQFTTMAGTVITLVLGFYFGGMAEKIKHRSGGEPEAGTTVFDFTAHAASKPIEEPKKEEEHE